MWANASQRAAQQTPVQRQQHPSTSQTPSRSSQTQGLPTPQQSQPPHDDMFPSGAQFANRLDDFRNGGQGISSQLGAGGQPQTGNIEEFPPLGRNAAADLPLGRTGALMQGGGFGNYGSGMSRCARDEPFSALNITRTSIVACTRTLYCHTFNNRLLTDPVAPGLGPSRSPVSQAPNGISGQEKEVGFAAAIQYLGRY
jgi:hypothetical protein